MDTLTDPVMAEGSVGPGVESSVVLRVWSWEIWGWGLPWS